MSDLEVAFHQEMLHTYDESVKAGYRPTRFLHMINESGGLVVAHRLMSRDDISDGFTDLWKRNRLDLSVEALILKPEYASLFSEEERQRARQRLHDVGYTPPWLADTSKTSAPSSLAAERSSRFVWEEGDITIIPPQPVTPQLDERNRHIWLFQANPRFYNLAEELKQTSIGDTDSWSVTRHGRNMRAGDQVILWQSGSQRGIYALGELIGEPYQRDWQLDEHDIAAQPFQSAERWVEFRFTRILETPILAVELKQHPLLKNLMVIRSPTGTNFAVTEEQWQALNVLLDTHTTSARQEADQKPFVYPIKHPTPQQAIAEGERSMAATQWPPVALDGEAFVLIHKGDRANQLYGETYTFSNYAGGEHKRLTTALESYVLNGLPGSVYVLFYRPDPFYAFTAWARVTGVHSEPGTRTNQTNWTLTLEQHEFPIPVNARGLIDQISWLNKGLVVAFRGYSIRQISFADFETIIEAARTVEESASVMTYSDAAFAILHQANGGPLHLAEILSLALEQGLIQPKGQTPQLTLSNALLRDKRFENLGRDVWQLAGLDNEAMADEADIIVPTLNAGSDAAIWRIHFPREHWDEAWKHGVIGIGWQADSTNQSVKRFRRIKIGDRIVAYVQGGVIGGIGAVTKLPDTMQIDEPDSKLFGGEYRQRIGVAWFDEPDKPTDISPELRSSANVALYNRIKNPHTVMPLSSEDYAAILAMLGVATEGGVESRIPTAWPQLASYYQFVQTLDDRSYRAEELLNLAKDFGEDFNENIDEDTLVDDLLQVRLLVEVALDAYQAAPYAKGNTDALLRLSVLALLVPAEGSADVFVLPALDIVPRLRNTEPQSIHEFAPELGNERLQLLEWYMEAGFVTVEDDTWVASADALQFIVRDDPASAFYNEFLRTLLAQLDGSLASHLSSVDGLPLPPSADLNARLRELAQELLIEEMIVRRIYRSLMAGRHVVLSGPPGTGKTELAKRLPALLWKEEAQTFTRLTFSLAKPPVETTTEQRHGYAAIVVTATEDWGIRDVVGGIGPQLDGRQGVSYTIQHGVLTRVVLQHYEQTDKGLRLPPSGAPLARRDYLHEDGRRYRGAWLVIDELTRAPVDAAFGSLLTTLGGGSEAVLAVPAPSGELRDINVPRDFRIIATLNSFDRHFLNQISEAIKRRFDFIDVLPPSSALGAYEQGIAAMQALRRLRANDVAGISIYGTPPVYEWQHVLKVAPITTDDDRQRYVLQVEDEEAERALASFWRLFQAIRVFRQLGTAQIVAIYTNLFSGVILGGMGWQDALDTALADSLADQLQVLNRDEQRVIDAYIEHAGAEAGAVFASRYNSILKELPAGRKQAARHALREADSARNGSSDIVQGDKEVTSEQVRRVFAPEQPLALPSRSLFQSRLRNLIGERGL